MAMLHGGVYRQTTTQHKSGNKMKRKKNEKIKLCNIIQCLQQSFQ